MKKSLFILAPLAMLLMASCGSFGEAFMESLATTMTYGYNPLMYSPTGSTANQFSSSSMSKSAMSDPNTAIPLIAQMSVAQVNNQWEQNYQAFASSTKKPDGSTYSRNEFYALMGEGLSQSSSSGKSNASSTRAKENVESTSSSENYTTVTRKSSSNQNSSQKCMKWIYYDVLHCNGSGKCQSCNGKGKYFHTELGTTVLIDPCHNCGGNGKCPSCGGTGYLNR